MKTALRTAVCRVCGEVLYEVESVTATRQITNVWLHDAPRLLQVGDILDVRYTDRLFSIQDEHLVHQNLRRINSVTADTASVYWDGRETIHVSPTHCGHCFIAVAVMDGARNPGSECAQCGAGIIVRHVGGAKVTVLHRYDESPYCRATPILDALDSN
jgi:hypothetical protein